MLIARRAFPFPPHHGCIPFVCQRKGGKCIGTLFPKKRMNGEPGKKKLGALPTRKVVHTLLNSRFHGPVQFMPNQMMDALAIGKSFHLAIPMLPNPLDEV